MTTRPEPPETYAFGPLPVPDPEDALVADLADRVRIARLLGTGETLDPLEARVLVRAELALRRWHADLLAMRIVRAPAVDGPESLPGLPRDGKLYRKLPAARSTGIAGTARGYRPAVPSRSPIRSDARHRFEAVEDLGAMHLARVGALCGELGLHWHHEDTAPPRASCLVIARVPIQSLNARLRHGLPIRRPVPRAPRTGRVGPDG